MCACALLWVKSQPCLAGHALPISSLPCGTWFLLVLKNHSSSIINVTILQKTFQAYLSLRTQDLLPDEKVVQEDGEGKPRVSHPQARAECCWRVLAPSPSLPAQEKDQQTWSQQRRTGEQSPHTVCL